MNPPLNLSFEPYNACTLKCPTCPTGRGDHKLDRTQLQPETLRTMLQVVSRQAEINRIGLFGWGAPDLSPLLPELVHVAKPFGQTYISVTLTHTRCDLQALSDSRPDVFIVAISGMTQAVYESGHPGGDIEVVKERLRTLSAMGAGVTITWHRYDDNLHEEDAARDFANSLGFKFVPHWATVMPVERLIAGDNVPHIIVPVPERMAIVRRQRDFVCGFQTSELRIASDGKVFGCSVASDTTSMGNILTDSLDSIMQAKRNFALCKSCYATSAYKAACGLNLEVDKECARRSKGHQLRYLVERTKKRVWTRKEMIKVEV